ncbi:hypothetical protein [uncultured Cohaesibacter sp.]|uniref:hypothetical protein n=1 Tax=uncultured Cohaesibacter sp. TaxID=1002546 RepID=UPI0029C8ED6E|nr:hypothetical protein [uncultured Cohaesibacter sp.]
MRRLFNRISRLEHVSAKIIRIGNVVEVDNESDRVKVKVGDGDPIDARWSSLASGAIKIRVTPSVGQVVTLICPNGGRSPSLRPAG